MFFLGKNVLKKLLLALFITALLVGAAYITYSYTIKQQVIKEQLAQREEFLTYVESGNLSSSTKLWPSVYTFGKDDEQFLADFSTTLHKTYKKLYEERYVNDSPSEDLYELARIYYDFIYEKDFISIADMIYYDYFNERIDYIQCASAINELYAISRRTSIYVAELLYKAADIHDSRNVFSQAESAAASEDYSNAIDIMRKVIPEDTIYYPIALEKIDEYIIKLRNLVKNGS